MAINLDRELQMLLRQQLAFVQGAEMLRQARSQLLRDKSSAEGWGQVAIIANAVLIPMNCIVNAFELKVAKSAYEVVVQSAYRYFSESGTRSEGRMSKAVSVLKDVTFAELKRKSMSEYLPGAAILFGFVQDSMALWQSVQLVSTGSREMNTLLWNIDSKIEGVEREMLRIGVRLESTLERRQLVNRTA